MIQCCRNCNGSIILIATDIGNGYRGYIVIFICHIDCLIYYVIKCIITVSSVYANGNSGIFTTVDQIIIHSTNCYGLWRIPVRRRER